MARGYLNLAKSLLLFFSYGYQTLICIAMCCTRFLLNQQRNFSTITSRQTRTAIQTKPDTKVYFCFFRNADTCVIQRFRRKRSPFCFWYWCDSMKYTETTWVVPSERTSYLHVLHAVHASFQTYPQRNNSLMKTFPPLMTNHSRHKLKNLQQIFIPFGTRMIRLK